MVGRFVEVDTPTRVVFRYGWEDGAFGLPPEASLVEIDLEDLGGRTRLQLRQTLLPTDGVDAHRYGWNFFLRRLAKRLADSPVI